MEKEKQRPKPIERKESRKKTKKKKKTDARDTNRNYAIGKIEAMFKDVSNNTGTCPDIFQTWSWYILEIEVARIGAW